MIIDKIKAKAIMHNWDLGFILDTKAQDYKNIYWDITYVKNRLRDRWFADPFIIEDGPSEIILLCEEFRYSTRRGRLAKLIVDKISMSIKEFKILLDLPTHLSYPAYFRMDGDIYIYPENSSSGVLTLYRYNSLNDILEEKSILLSMPAIDASIVHIEDSFYIFSTLSTELSGNGNSLHIFKSDTIDGSYTHYQTIELSDNTARGAGDFFYDGLKLIRPAQICNTGYGKGLVFQEVKLKDSMFIINEVHRKLPPTNYIGMHTYNKYGDIAVLDFYCPRYPFLNKCFWVLRNLFKK